MQYLAENMLGRDVFPLGDAAGDADYRLREKISQRI